MSQEDLDYLKQKKEDFEEFEKLALRGAGGFIGGRVGVGLGLMLAESVAMPSAIPLTLALASTAIGVHEFPKLVKDLDKAGHLPEGLKKTIKKDYKKIKSAFYKLKKVV
jgi:hypothetical protein